MVVPGLDHDLFLVVACISFKIISLEEVGLVRSAGGSEGTLLLAGPSGVERAVLQWNIWYEVCSLCHSDDHLGCAHT